MTAEESVRFYEDMQAYFDKCEAFKEEVRKFFEHYKPRNHDLKNRHQPNS